MPLRSERSGPDHARLARIGDPPLQHLMHTLRDQVIAAILAGIRSPRKGRKPAIRTRIDRRYETLRIGMQDLFHELGISPITAAA